MRPILLTVDTAPAPVGIGADSSTGSGPSRAHSRDDVEARRLKWEAKQLDGSRPLGAWELYRALNDALDEGHDQFDLSNRDARLAMILMGGLNAALVILASQTSLGAGLSSLERQIEGGVIAVYALFAIVFLLQADRRAAANAFPSAIRQLVADDRPRLSARRPLLRRRRAARYRSHWQAWRNISVQQLNAELAVQLHSLCLKNQARKIALRGLYRSLRNHDDRLLGDPAAVRDLHLLLAALAAASSRTRGATFRPISSMLASIFSCGRVPLLYFRSKRDRPSACDGADDLRRHGLRRADAQRAVRPGLVLELRARCRRPSALAADAVHHRLVVRPQLLLRLLVGRGDVAGRVHGDRLRLVAELLERLVIQIDVRPEARRAAADDRQRQRQAVARRAHHRLGTAADADPRAQRALLDRRIDDLVLSAPSASSRSTSPGRPSAAPQTARASPRTAARSATGRSRTADTTR